MCWSICQYTSFRETVFSFKTKKIFHWRAGAIFQSMVGWRNVHHSPASKILNKKKTLQCVLHQKRQFSVISIENSSVFHSVILCYFFKYDLCYVYNHQSHVCYTFLLLIMRDVSQASHERKESKKRRSSKSWAII